jgi:hypothetical protein
VLDAAENLQSNVCWSLRRHSAQCRVDLQGCRRETSSGEIFVYPRMNLMSYGWLNLVWFFLQATPMKYMDGTPFLAKFDGVKPNYSQAGVGVHEKYGSDEPVNPELPPNAGRLF